METTFISIHDLSLDARLLYVSQSIPEILGWQPHEVQGKSCWEYFHPDEIPFAQSIHGRTIQMDKAAVLRYCRIKAKDGKWRGCECVFTVVHDVIVASTSIYKAGPQTAQRARDAPVVRQMFASSPRDPRYHMLQYISSKFSQAIPRQPLEPRAALFINRFTRTLNIMYATNGLADLLGITSDRLVNKSFYYCMQENCLREGVRCLESAKANDSIAYLRFWWRDPTQEEPTVDPDERMSTDDDDGGVHLAELMDQDGSENAVTTGSNSMRSSAERDTKNDFPVLNSRSQSGNSTDSTDMGMNSNENMFDGADNGHSGESSVTTPEEPRASAEPWSPGPASIELEAVVSCTSDGLVVILRGARPFVPQIAAPAQAAHHPYQNGLFASPWADHPIVPERQQRSGPLPDHLQPPRFPLNPTAQQASTAGAKGPPTEDVMNSIREVAVFAWALTGINGSLAQYGQGTPSGESQPQRLEIWQPPDNNPGSGPPNGSPFGNRQLPSPHIHGDVTAGSEHGQRTAAYGHASDPSLYSNHRFANNRNNMSMDGASDHHVPKAQYQSHQAAAFANGCGMSGQVSNGWGPGSAYAQKGLQQPPQQGQQQGQPQPH